MDKFLDSNFGDRSIQLDANGVPLQATMSNMSRIQ